MNGILNSEFVKAHQREAAIGLGGVGVSTAFGCTVALITGLANPLNAMVFLVVDGLVIAASGIGVNGLIDKHLGDDLLKATLAKVAAWGAIFFASSILSAIAVSLIGFSISIGSAICLSLLTITTIFITTLCLGTCCSPCIVAWIGWGYVSDLLEDYPEVAEFVKKIPDAIKDLTGGGNNPSGGTTGGGPGAGAGTGTTGGGTPGQGGGFLSGLSNIKNAVTQVASLVSDPNVTNVVTQLKNAGSDPDALLQVAQNNPEIVNKVVDLVKNNPTMAAKIAQQFGIDPNLISQVGNLLGGAGGGSNPTPPGVVPTAGTGAGTPGNIDPTLIAPLIGGLLGGASPTPPGVVPPVPTGTTPTAVPGSDSATDDELRAMGLLD